MWRCPWEDKGPRDRHGLSCRGLWPRAHSTPACKGDFLRAGPEVWLCSHGCGISGGYPLWDPLSHLSGREKAWTPHRAATSARPTADAQRTLKPCVQTHISERSEINRCVCSSPRIDAWEVVDVNLHKGGPRCVSLVSVSHEFVVWPKENRVGS